MPFPVWSNKKGVQQAYDILTSQGNPHRTKVVLTGMVNRTFELLVEEQREIPHLWNLLEQPYIRFHQNVQMLNLHARRL